MSLIKCPECGKEISDQADNCPNCGRPIHPNKKTNRIAIGVIAGICGVIGIIVLLSAVFDLFDAFSNSDSSQTISQEVTPTESLDKVSDEIQNEVSDSELDFIPVTEEDYENLLLNGVLNLDNLSNLTDPLVKTCKSIGVKEIDKNSEFGNYNENSGIYSLDIKFLTENNTTLLVSMMYISMTQNSEWSVISIRNFNTGQYYYVPDEQKETVDIYDYTTGKLLSEKSTNTSDSVKDAYKILGVE